MARVGGRNTWIAVPAGLACTAIVAALVWLAIPMVPVAVQWMGDTLRTATEQAQGTPPANPAEPAVLQAADCRALYPDGLWAELALRGDTVLEQDASPPQTSAASVMAALSPDVKMTCRWRTADGMISTTLATIAPDALAIAEVALRGQGFSCATASGLLQCMRAQEGVVEEHALEGDVWLSSVESGWRPEHYGTRLATYLWG